jgi:hypothetical protein
VGNTSGEGVSQMNGRTLRKTLRGLWMIAAALAVVSCNTPALAAIMFGSLSNFDVVNDTNSGHARL